MPTAWNALIYATVLLSRSSSQASRPAVNHGVYCMRNRDGHSPLSKCIGSTHIKRLSFSSFCVFHHTRANYFKQYVVPRSSLTSRLGARRFYSILLRTNHPSRLKPIASISLFYSSTKQEGSRGSPDDIAGGHHTLTSPLSGVMSRLDNLKSYWTAFEELDQFQIEQIPTEELLALASWSYEAYLLPRKSSALSDVLSKRLRHLANTLKALDDNPLKKNVPQGSSYAEWTSYLIIQALILSEELETAVDMLLISLRTSENRISPQHIQSLRQLFIAFSHRSTTDAIKALSKIWLKVRRELGTHVPEHELYSVVEEFRGTMAAIFGPIKEAVHWLQSVDEPSLQQIGTSIIVFVYGKQESAIVIQQVYRDFITRRFSMTWETHIRVFRILLSKQAHVLAYYLWKDAPSLLQDNYNDVNGIPELIPFNDLESLRDRLPALTQAYLESCINASPQSLAMLAALSDEELSLEALLALIDTSKLVDLANMVMDKTRIRAGDVNKSHTGSFAEFLDCIVKQLSREPREASQLTIDVFKWHICILRADLSTVGESLVKILRYSGGIPDVRIIRATTQLFLSAEDLYDLPTAFEYLVSFWQSAFILLNRSGERFHGEYESTEFRRSVLNAFAAVNDPLLWIMNFPKTPEAMEIATCIFFMVLGQKKDTDTAWHLFQESQSRGMSISFEEHIRLMQMFMSCQALEYATQVQDSFLEHFADQVADPEKRTKNELHTSLMLASQLGDWEAAHEHFDVMVIRGFADAGARVRLLHAYAMVGDTNRTREIFFEFYPDGGPQKPSLRDFRTLIYAHIRAGDIHGIHGWVERMTKAGIQPNVAIYDMILLAFAKLQDLESAAAVLTKMYQNKIKPDRFAFTTIISILADRKDPVAAEGIYKRALKEGVVPDAVMNTALMDAHVEAGSWRGAIRVFDYINQTKVEGSRDTTRLFNTLLKAYVLIGAPFNVVYALFQRMRRKKLIPNIVTYSLVIQSACDSGRMDTARELFNEFDLRPLFGKKKTHVDSYLLTILMAGYLRNGDPTIAKAVYDDMQTRGLRPGAVTFGIIVHSFANQRSTESLAIAEDFMRGLMEGDDKERTWLASNPGGRPKALEAVFAPLLTIYGQDMDIRSVERLFDSMLSLGGEPTMIALNVLMDAYRRAGNLEGVQQIWVEAVEVARRFLNKDLFESLGPEQSQNKAKGSTSEETSSPQHNENSLCLSLSIYISALSAAGRHVEIAKVWRQVRDWGFAFDAHNWNHLAVALVRAGEVERAFEIVERVLLPYSLQNRQIVRSRRKKPKSPLSFFDETVSLPQDVLPPSSPPLASAQSAMRGTDRKPKPQEEKPEPETESETKQAVRMRTESRRIEALELSTRNESWLSSSEIDDAQPLYELQQMSAHYQGWRTHVRVLDALGWAMETLKSGRRVIPMGSGIQRDRVISGEDVAEDEPVDAEKVLERIGASYPRAMMMVHMHLLGNRYRPPF